MTSARGTNGNMSTFGSHWRSRSMVQAVCECVRIKSSLACATAHNRSGSVYRSRVSPLQHAEFTSLRGWR